MATRQDLYQRVTDAIVAELERGVPPWVRPWKMQSGFGGLPYNGQTERAYRGVNVWLLLISAQEAGFDDPRWYTVRQANLVGAHIRRKEKATHIVFWKQRDVRVTGSETGGEVSKAVPMLRSYWVFNAQQVEGLEPLAVNAQESEEVRYGRAQELLTRSNADVRFRGEQAFFHPGLDYVQLPPRGAFESEEAFWGTLFHELTHWSGHGSRLGRDLSGRFGSDSYAAEELVAEMGAAFLCASLGIEGRLRHSEYIGHWLGILRDDKRVVFRASSLAQAAADYLSDVTEAATSEP